MARAIEQLKQAMEVCELGALTLPDQVDALMDAARAILQEISTLTPPNEPLTLEELREMSGHPVWVKQLKGLSVCDTDWAVVEFRLEPDVKHDKIRVWWPGSEDEDTPSEDDYGKTWIAYRRPPEVEEEEKHVIEITENL